jgi:hypothetical protein
MPTESNSASPASVSIDTSLAEAARLMTAFNLASIPVLEHEAIAGTLTYRDAVRGLRRARHGLGVSALMTADPIGSNADVKLPERAVGGPVGIEERAPGLFEPDVLLPSQYFDRLRRSAEYDPERRLIVAVLEQGVNDYLKHAGAREPKELELWQEVEAWVEDRDASWLFSFENICHVLDLEPDYLRRGLHAHKERVRRGTREEPPSSAAPETRPERARARSG